MALLGENRPSQSHDIDKKKKRRTRMKHLFIVNPAARQGNRTTFATTLIQQAFERREAKYEIYITKYPGDGAEKIARDAQYERDGSGRSRP